MRLRVDFQKCIKAGECYYNHPAMFKAGKDALPTVLIENIDTRELEIEAESAIDVCPGMAIFLDKV